jgi:hypothetical protein
MKKFLKEIFSPENLKYAMLSMLLLNGTSSLAVQQYWEDIRKINSK